MTVIFNFGKPETWTYVVVVKLKNILIVDDNKDVADLFGHYIEMPGCKAIIAHDGLRALEPVQVRKPD